MFRTHALPLGGVRGLREKAFGLKVGEDGVRPRRNLFLLTGAARILGERV